MKGQKFDEHSDKARPTQFHDVEKHQRKTRDACTTSSGKDRGELDPDKYPEVGNPTFLIPFCWPMSTDLSLQTTVWAARTHPVLWIHMLCGPYVVCYHAVLMKRQLKCVMMLQDWCCAASRHPQRSVQMMP